MVRFISILVLIGLAVVGLGWLGDQQGQVSITLAQSTVTIRSLPVAALALMMVVIVLTLVLGALRGVFSLPQRLSAHMHGRRRAHGLKAVTQGLIAIGSGDAARAHRLSVLAEKTLGDEPLALLLRAQAAQLTADKVGAEAAFRAMLETPEARPLGLRGLFVEARRRDDREAALAIAAEAARTSPSLPWAGMALLELQCASSDWNAALATLQRNARQRLVSQQTAQRHRAILLTARAMSEVDTNRSAARASVLEAVKLAPDLVAAAVLAARLLSENNETRKAVKCVEAAWRLAPHPDLADAYLKIRTGESPREKLARMQALAEMVPGHMESRIAVARAALAAHEQELARSSLAPLVAAGPGPRICLLMARIEEKAPGADGKVREWLARAAVASGDPVWTADGVVSDVWLPVSPVTGRLDAFEWKPALAHIGVPLDISADGGDAEAHDTEEPQAIRLEHHPAPQLVPEPEEKHRARQEAAPAPAHEQLRMPPRRVAPAMPVVATHPLPDDPGVGQEEPQRVVRFPMNG